MQLKEEYDRILLYVSNFAETLLFLDIGHGNRCNVKVGYDWILLYVSNFAETPLFLDIGNGNECNVKEGYDGVGYYYLYPILQKPYFWILDTVIDATLKRDVMEYVSNFAETPLFLDIGYVNRFNVNKEG